MIRKIIDWIFHRNCTHINLGKKKTTVSDIPMEYRERFMDITLQHYTSLLESISAQKDDRELVKFGHYAMAIKVFYNSFRQQIQNERTVIDKQQQEAKAATEKKDGRKFLFG